MRKNGASASFRILSRTSAVIPKSGVPLSSWHKEMGLKVAELYGVRIDPETLIVIGNGAPIGYPLAERTHPKTVVTGIPMDGGARSLLRDKDNFSDPKPIVGGVTKSE